MVDDSQAVDKRKAHVCHSEFDDYDRCPNHVGDDEDGGCDQLGEDQGIDHDGSAEHVSCDNGENFRTGEAGHHPRINLHGSPSADRNEGADNGPDAEAPGLVCGGNDG